MRISFLGSLILLILCNSCGKDNPNPSWFEVNEWTLQANDELTGLEGELTHNFTDAWVFIDGDVIGIFEVPFKIPILKEGNVNIQIFPTIRNNGIGATKKAYPFVEKYEINAELVQNQTLTLNPTTRYSKYTEFWIEDFEGASMKIENDPNSQTTMIKTSDPQISQWGDFGKVYLNSTDSTWVAYTNGQMNLPRGEEVYLEIDYYSTNNITTGVLAISSTSIVNNQNVQINAQEPSTIKWKKIYIDLKEIVSNSPLAEYFEQSFQAVIDDGDSEGQIIIDNIKVVHF